MDTSPTLPAGDEPLVDELDAPALSTLDEETFDQPPIDEWTGPRCEKCDAPIKSDAVSVCRSCGWYARLGTYLEVDPDWETEDDTEEQGEQKPAPSLLEVWRTLLPPWAWVIIGTVLLVVAESAIVRLTTTAGSGFRTAWSLTQLIVGLLTFFGCHVFFYLLLAADDADVGLLDIILRPLKIWNRILRELPAKLWAVDTAAAGLTAVVMSIVLIGGLPYHRLLDWGIEPPKEKEDLRGAVMSQIQSMSDEGGADSLEDAVGELAGTQDLTEEEPPPPPPKPREETECVILGYRTNKEGLLHTLLLGTAYKGKLIYAGTINPPLNEEEQIALAQLLSTATIDGPVLPLQTEAIWVEPKYACLVSYVEKTENGRLKDMRWEEFLGGMTFD